MTEIKVDHDVKIPSDARGGRSTYPWKEMKKGDSFFTTSRWMGGVAQNAAMRIGNGCQFTIRSVIENGKKGFRVWRVK